MDEASTISLSSQRTKHSDDNIHHPTTSSNNSDTNEDRLKGSVRPLKR